MYFLYSSFVVKFEYYSNTKQLNKVCTFQYFWTVTLSYCTGVFSKSAVFIESMFVQMYEYTKNLFEFSIAVRLVGQFDSCTKT